jgi:GT2 family glycosyltransferase
MGFCAGNNAALKQAKGEYVALINNDAVPEPDWLKNLVTALDGCPRAGFAASKMLFPGNPALIDRAGDAYTWAGAGLLRGRGRHAGAYCRREWIFGACAGAAMYRTRMLDDIGWFDEDFFLLYEDVDLSFRAQLKGYRCLFVPEGIVHHMPSSTLRHDSPVSVYYGHRNLEWVYVKNLPAGLVAMTLFPHVVYVMGALFFFTATGRGRTFLRSKKDALKGLGRMLRKRRRIQRERRVGGRTILRLMDNEALFSRLTSRGMLKFERNAFQYAGYHHR